MARLILTMAAALLVACGGELDPGQVARMLPAKLLELDPDQVPENIFELTAEADVDFEDTDLDPEQAAVAKDAWELYQEMASRLAERGVTFGELYAAILANDEEAVTEMFGYTAEEFEAIYKRLVDIAERARAAGFEGWGTSPGDLEAPVRPE